MLIIILLSSAILYLNGDFEGGKFFFAHSTKDLTPQVSPKSGQMYSTSITTTHTCT